MQSSIVRRNQLSYRRRLESNSEPAGSSSSDEENPRVWDVQRKKKKNVRRCRPYHREPPASSSSSSSDGEFLFNHLDVPYRGLMKMKVSEADTIYLRDWAIQVIDPEQNVDYELFVKYFIMAAKDYQGINVRENPPTTILEKYNRAEFKQVFQENAKRSKKFIMIITRDEFREVRDMNILFDQHKQVATQFVLTTCIKHVTEKKKLSVLKLMLEKLRNNLTNKSENNFF